MNNLSDYLRIQEICNCANIISTSGNSKWKLILCPKKKGKERSCPIPGITDKEVCVGMESKPHPDKFLPDLTVNLDYMHDCPDRDYQKKV